MRIVTHLLHHTRLNPSRLSDSKLGLHIRYLGRIEFSLPRAKGITAVEKGARHRPAGLKGVPKLAVLLAILLQTGTHGWHFFNVYPKWAPSESEQTQIRDF